MAEPALVDELIKRVMSIAIWKSEKKPSAGGAKGPTYIGHFYSRTTGLSDLESKLLGIVDLDDVNKSLVLVANLHNGNPLSSLHAVYCNTTSLLKSLKDGSTPSEYSNLLQKFGHDRFEGLILDIEASLMSSATLLLACPSFFDICNHVDKHEIRKEYLDVLDDNVFWKRLLEFFLGPHITSFVTRTFDGLFESDLELAKGACEKLFGALLVYQRSIKTWPHSDLRLLNELFANAKVASVFLEVFRTRELATSPLVQCGSFRDLFTFWGRLMSPTPLNEEMIYFGTSTGFTARVEGVECARCRDFHGTLRFGGISTYDGDSSANAAPRDVINACRQTFVAKRKEYQEYMNLLVQVVKVLLKSCLENRFLMLRCMGRLISLNSNRRRVDRLTTFNSPPSSLDPMYFQRLIMIRDNNFGHCINFTWLLLLLARGIPSAKVVEVDVAFCQSSLACEKLKTESNAETCSRISSSIGEMLGRLGDKPASMGDEAEVLQAWHKLNTSLQETHDQAKFITQIYWQTLEALGTMFLPCIHEYVKIVHHTVSAFAASAASGSMPRTLQETNEALSHIYVWRCAIQNPGFLEPLSYFINMSCMLLIKCALYYDAHGNPRSPSLNLNNRNSYLELVDSFCKNPDAIVDVGQSPQFAMLPVDLIETTLELIKHLCTLRHYGSFIRPFENNALDHLDLELVVATSIFLMRCPATFIKNTSLTCDLSSNVIMYLANHCDLVLTQYQVAHTHIVGALVDCFINSQKTSFNFRVSCRVNIVEVLVNLFNDKNFKSTFVQHVANADFTHYFHLLLSDVVAIFEEVVVCLGEVRRRELLGLDSTTVGGAPAEGAGQASTATTTTTTTSVSATTSSAGVASGESAQGAATATADENDSAEDTAEYTQEGAIDPNVLKSMPFDKLKQKTRSYVEYFTQLLHLVDITCTESSRLILSVPVLLPQVASSLGCCLEHLVGETSIQLKVKNMAEYNFEPKSWLCKVIKCSLALWKQDDKRGFLKALVAEKGRYYKHETFNKCFRILVREMWLTSAQRGEFHTMTQQLWAQATESDAFSSAMESQVPEEFLDPIMNDLMEDPVLLPTSGKIVDRKVIERHLMSEPTDPFTRAPLDKSQLVAQVELKEKIITFIKTLQYSGDLL